MLWMVSCGPGSKTKRVAMQCKVLSLRSMPLRALALWLLCQAHIVITSTLSNAIAALAVLITSGFTEMILYFGALVRLALDL